MDGPPSPHEAALVLYDLIELRDDHLIDESGEWHSKLEAGGAMVHEIGSCRRNKNLV